MVNLFGIPTCDSTKKAMTWLKNHNIPFELHDYKKEGVSRQRLKAWADKFGWEKLLNKQSTTWRGLAAEEQEKIKNERAALSFMVKYPTLIKRPVAEHDNDILVGFNENEYIVKFDPRA